MKSDEVLQLDLFYLTCTDTDKTDDQGNAIRDEHENLIGTFTAATIKDGPRPNVGVTITPASLEVHEDYDNSEPTAFSVKLDGPPESGRTVHVRLTRESIGIGNDAPGALDEGAAKGLDFAQAPQGGALCRRAARAD